RARSVRGAALDRAVHRAQVRARPPGRRGSGRATGLPAVTFLVLSGTGGRALPRWCLDAPGAHPDPSWIPHASIRRTTEGAEATPCILLRRARPASPLHRRGDRPWHRTAPGTL